MKRAQTDLESLPQRGRPERTRGRGRGSRSGKTSSYGDKGSQARKGAKGAPLEGGQSPLVQRMGKRGFSRPFSPRPAQVVNIADLERFEAGMVVDAESLEKAGLARRNRPVKILGTGRLTRKLTVVADAFSRSARAV